MRIGFYTWDGCVHPTPAVARAVVVARAALERMGHTVSSLHGFQFITTFVKNIFYELQMVYTITNVYCLT